VQIDRDHDAGFDQACVNAMSTRIRHFGAVGAGQSGAMSVNVGIENARNQRLVR
jgi:hypothetical protein